MDSGKSSIVTLDYDNFPFNDLAFDYVLMVNASQILAFILRRIAKGFYHLYKKDDVVISH